MADNLVPGLAFLADNLNPRLIVLGGQPVSGSEGLELKAITAAALGSAAVKGGKGGVGGTLLAVALLGCLENGLTVEGINTYWQNVAQGALLVTAVTIQQRRTGERPH
ncbi:hypothetical protein ACFVYE_33100 [Streptomyces sp. NPDC058239]|uniref:hypothetical protein n=1 Tax=unclassified Streptomyces TaxID=2593676 RepID=UPI00365920DF